MPGLKSFLVCAGKSTVPLFPSNATGLCKLRVQLPDTLGFQAVHTSNEANPDQLLAPALFPKYTLIPYLLVICHNKL